MKNKKIPLIFEDIVKELIKEITKEFLSSLKQCPECNTWFIHLSKRERACCTPLCASRRSSRKRRECFDKNTLISTPNESIKIKDLKIGNIVLTQKGPKKIKNTIEKKDNQ